MDYGQEQLQEGIRAYHANCCSFMRPGCAPRQSVTTTPAVHPWSGPWSVFLGRVGEKKNGTPSTGSSWAGSVGFCRIKNAMPTIKGSTTDQSSEGDIERAAN